LKKSVETVSSTLQHTIMTLELFAALHAKGKKKAAGKSCRGPQGRLQARRQPAVRLLLNETLASGAEGRSGGSKGADRRSVSLGAIGFLESKAMPGHRF
jgi:hypothetical protein